MTNRGVAYIGPGKVEVQSIDFPKLSLGSRKCEHGVILKVVSTNICGSDQHMVRGRTTAPTGLILGHEITGEVIEAGRDVEFIKVGDLVSVPFNVACGRCRNCKEGRTGICLNVNPARPGAAYGYVDMGGWIGGQASYVMCPYADFNLLKFPDKAQRDGEDSRPDAAVGYFPDRLSRRGDSGRWTGIDRLCRGRRAGGLGLRGLLPPAGSGSGDRGRYDCRTARASAQLRLRDSGFAQRRLRSAIRSQPSWAFPKWTQLSIALDSKRVAMDTTAGVERPATVLNSVMTVTRAGGAIGIPGLYVTDDPGGVDQNAKIGNLGIRIGLGWAKSHSFATGQCPVMKLSSPAHAGDSATTRSNRQRL